MHLLNFIVTQNFVLKSPIENTSALVKVIAIIRRQVISWTSDDPVQWRLNIIYIYIRYLLRISKEMNLNKYDLAPRYQDDFLASLTKAYSFHFV